MSFSGLSGELSKPRASYPNLSEIREKHVGIACSFSSLVWDGMGWDGTGRGEEGSFRKASMEVSALHL